MTPLRIGIIMALAWLLAAVGLTLGAEVDEHRLYHIERNKNANIVVYSAQVLENGDLHQDDPVIVFWLKLAEGGHRKDLKGIERRLAYGFKVESREGNRVVLDMKADVGRDVIVDRHEDGYGAFIEIQGQQALLDHIFIFANEGWGLPKVEYLELFGTDLETGEEVYEKLIP